MPSKFIELLHEDDHPRAPPRRISSFDVRLEDVLAHHEASIIGLRSRSFTFSSSKASLVHKMPSYASSSSTTMLSSLSTSAPSTASSSGSGSASSPPSSSPSRWKRFSNTILGSRRAS